MHPFIAIGNTVRLPMYGLMMVTGAALSILCAFLTAKKRELDPNHVFQLSVFCLLFGLIGAKLLAIMTDIPHWFSHFSIYGFSFSYIWQQITHSGIVFYGGLLGGILGGWLYVRLFQLDFWRYFDGMIPWLPLAHGFGRLGCFFAGCCYGNVTRSHIGVVFDNEITDAGSLPRIPVQLFEACFCFFVLLPALFFFAYKLAVNIKIRPEPRIAADLSGRERKPGQVAGLYLTVYSVFRFIIEFYRGDEARGVWGGVTTSQWISLFLLPIGIILLIGNIPLIRPTNPALVTPEGFILVPDEDLDRAPDEAPAEEESGEDAPEDAEEKDDHK